jgi:hypothetical protein
MCRTCHSAGTTKLRAWGDRCTHALLPRGECGQCHAIRPLVECHAYDFREGLARRTPVRKRNPQRRRANFARAYGGAERVTFVASLGCAVGATFEWATCSGNVQNAHTRNGGMGRKANAKYTAPLCAGHHHLLHDWGRDTFERIYGINLDDAAEAVEMAWRAYKEGQA